MCRGDSRAAVAARLREKDGFAPCANGLPGCPIRAPTSKQLKRWETLDAAQPGGRQRGALPFETLAPTRKKGETKAGVAWFRPRQGRSERDAPRVGKSARVRPPSLARTEGCDFSAERADE